MKCKSDPSFYQLFIETSQIYQTKDHYILFLNGKTQNFPKITDFLPNTILNNQRQNRSFLSRIFIAPKHFFYDFLTFIIFHYRLTISFLKRLYHYLWNIDTTFDHLYILHLLKFLMVGFFMNYTYRIVYWWFA